MAAPAELERWEAAARERSALEARRSEIEERLHELASGQTLPELMQAVLALGRDEIEAKKRELEEELEENERARDAARDQITAIERGTLRLGSQAAADSAQRLSEIAAEIREKSLAFARLALSRAVLERELVRFREEHQGPVLRRASELFRRLTLGEYEGLRVGLDERVLECVRREPALPAQGTAELPFNGHPEVGLGVSALSEGTRYQLYFALRLASLELYLTRETPLPVVLDDVFIHWDEARAFAGLELLGELAQRTQVLLFTHHSHLSELALRALPDGRAVRHELPGTRTRRLLRELTP